MWAGNFVQFLSKFGCHGNSLENYHGIFEFAEIDMKLEMKLCLFECVVYLCNWVYTIFSVFAKSSRNCLKQLF